MAKKYSLYELKASLSHLQWHPVKYAEIGRRNGIQFNSMPHCMSVDSFARASDNVCVKISWVVGKGAGIDAEIVKFYDQFNIMSDKEFESSYGEDFISPSDELLLKASEYDPDADSEEIYEEPAIDDTSIDEEILSQDAEVAETDELAQIQKEKDEEESNKLPVDDELEIEEDENQKVLAEAFSDVVATNVPANNTLMTEDVHEGETVHHPFFYLIFSFRKAFKLNDDSNRSGPLEYSDAEIVIEALKNSNETREIHGEKIKDESPFLFSVFTKLVNNNAFYFYKNLSFAGADTTPGMKKYEPLDVDISGHLGTNEFK